jgi:hypothetical protein
MNLVKNGFNKLPFADLLAKTNFIVRQMTVHADVFVTPIPSLDVVQGNIDVFAATMPDAEAGNKVAKSLRRDATKSLIKTIRKLGLYVDLVSDSDYTVAKKSGFDVREPRSSQAPIASIDTPRLKPGPNSSFHVQMTYLRPVKTYNVYYTKNPAAPIEEWKMKQVTNSKCLLTDVDSACRYHVMVAGIGKDEQKVFSGVATIVTQ